MTISWAGPASEAIPLDIKLYKIVTVGLFLLGFQMASPVGSQVTAEAGPQWMGYWKIPEPEIEVKEKLGVGQAANVFRAAWKTWDNRPVAAKIINFFSDREVRV